MKSRTCGIQYILECIKESKNNEHYAYLTEETTLELKSRGFIVEQKDKHTMAKITWARF